MTQNTAKDFANPTMAEILRANPMLQWRVCMDCDTIDLFEGNMQPEIQCRVCRNPDTRHMVNANRLLHRLDETPVSDVKPVGIEREVCLDIAKRQALGINKYGTTVADSPLALREWLNHAYEEMLDQAVYLRRAIAELDATTPTESTSNGQ